MELTSTELHTLSEAMDAWVTAWESGEILGDLMGAMLAEKDPKAKIDIERERNKRREEQRQQVEQRKEVATLIKAKLIYPLSTVEGFLPLTVT